MATKKDNEFLEKEKASEHEATSEMQDADNTAENAIAAEQIKEEIGEKVETPPEAAGINTDNKTATKATKKTAQAAKKNTKIVHGRRYNELARLVEKGMRYEIDEALELVKKTAKTKFDSSVEVHIKLLEKKSKKKATEETNRGIIHLPHGLGKMMRVIILDEAKAEEIARTKKVDFDVAIATPALMPKLGKIAKILGPKGKMPNPKLGTVTEHPEKIKEEIEQGRVEYRADASGVIHQMIGKASWDTDKLKDNLLAMLQIIAKKNIQSVVLSSTMGPGIRVEW